MTQSPPVTLLSKVATEVETNGHKPPRAATGRDMVVVNDLRKVFPKRARNTAPWYRRLLPGKTTIVKILKLRSSRKGGASW